MEELVKIAQLRTIFVEKYKTLYVICQKWTRCTAYNEAPDDYNCQGCMADECDSEKVTCIEERKSDSIAFDIIERRIGETIFLTREEAEKHL